MIAIDSANAGSHVRFRVTTFAADNLTIDADSVPEITIYSGEPDFDTEVLAATVMTKANLGTYDYWWDTTGLDTDTYLAVAPSVVEGHSNNNRVQIRILSATA